MSTLFVRDSYIQPHSLHFHADNSYDKYTYTPLDESKRGQWSIADDVLTMTNEDGTTYILCKLNNLEFQLFQGGVRMPKQHVQLTPQTEIL